MARPPTYILSLEARELLDNDEEFTNGSMGQFLLSFLCYNTRVTIQDGKDTMQMFADDHPADLAHLYPILTNFESFASAAIDLGHLI